jgi:hypothetical protein
LEIRPCRAGSEPDWRTRGSSPIEKVDSAQAGLDHLPLVHRQLLGGQPTPTGDAEEVGRRRASPQIPDQDRVHLVLLACPLPHQLRAARDPPAQDTCPFVRRPHLGQKASREQLRQRARVAGKTLREQLERGRRRLDPPRTAHMTTLGDRDLAEVTVHIQRDEAHAYLLSLAAQRRRGGQNDNYGSVLTAHPGSRRGGQLQTTGSQPIVSATACPTSFLPEAPVPEQPTTLHQVPDATAPRSDLHAPTTTEDLTAHST